MASSGIYQFKITLKRTNPPIWRRLQVPQTYSFYEFHLAIQDAMGWGDCHLHQFEIVNPHNGDPELIGSPCDEPYESYTVHPGWKKKLSSYFSLINTEATYDYDFGDDWSHAIVLEKILPRETGVIYPRCLAGKRACPPEDCGGVWGYEELLETLKSPKRKAYQELFEWLGGPFDPEAFDPDQVTFPSLHGKGYPP